MASWKDIRAGIDRFISWTKGDSVVNGAAKVALKSIPVVGSTLAAIYEEIDPAEQGAEGTTELLLEILAHVEQIGPGGLDEVAATLEAMQQTGETSRATLVKVGDRIRELQAAFEETRAEMHVMTDTLDRVEAELYGLAWGERDFKPESVADRVSYLVLLQSLLQESKVIFDEQLVFAQKITASFERPVPVEYVGFDDKLWWGKRQGLIPEHGKIGHRFHELRRITDRMREVNMRVRSLVRSGKPMLPASVKGPELDEHLSTWIAKYDYMQRHHDRDMCLIFVGVEPTNVPFPDGVDKAVKAELTKVMAAAGLEHVAAP